MQAKRYLPFILAIFSSGILLGQERVPAFSGSGIPLSEVAEFIEQKTSARIFYLEKEIQEITCNINTQDSTTVEQLLKIAVVNTPILISRWNGNFLLLRNKLLLTQLPNYERISDVREVEQTQQQTALEKRYMQGRRSDVLETIVIGDKRAPAQGKVRVAGRITDRNTGEPLIGATIYVDETQTGAATDVNGFFSIILSRGKFNAQFASLGYETGKYLLDVYSNGRMRVSLETAAISLQEATIMGDRQMDIKRKDPGLEKISLQSVKALPMMMGERDILKISEMLPGIVSVGEGSVGINVRGGSSDQNAFYINKVPIYNTSHLFGFFPAFNSDIIKDFAIYKGHIPVNYGGRLSSVFNITTRQGNRNRFSMHGGINPFSANLTVETPIEKEKSSVLVSARSSYSDWILQQVNDPTIRESSAGFNDFSINIGRDFERSTISAFIYSSDDSFDLSDITSYTYSNRGGSVNLYHQFNSLLRMNMSLIGSQYSYTTRDNQLVSNAYQHDYLINHYEFRTEFNQTVNEWNELDFGFVGKLYDLDRGTVRPFGDESLRKDLELGRERGLETALYISDKIKVASWMEVNAGLRYSLYTPLGPQTIYTYLEGKPLDDLFRQDTLFVDSHSAVKWYGSPEVRVSVNMETDVNGSVKLAFNQASQNLFMLNNTVTIAPNTQWKLADYHIRPSRSNQYSAGVFRKHPAIGLESSLDIYYKQTRDYTEFKDGADFLNSPNVETAVLQGDLDSYGVEFMLRKKSGRLNGWMAYTYSRSFIQVNGTEPWEQINNGLRYPSNFDIPHVLNTVLNYSIVKRITLSGTVTYQTGKPSTYPVSVYFMEGISTVDYFQRNRYRIPDYFRLDLSLTIEGNLKKNKLAHSSWMFSLYNLTGRNNAYSVYFESDNGRIKSYKFSVIGVPLFTATWIIKLGNYVSH